MTLSQLKMVMNALIGDGRKVPNRIIDIVPVEADQSRLEPAIEADQS